MRAFRTVIVFISYLVTLQHVSGLDSSNIVFIILSQSEPYHASVATRLKEDIEAQMLDIQPIRPKVHMTHIDYPVRGAWTVYPLLPKLLVNYHDSDVRWVVFLETHTVVRCSILLEVLNEADQNPESMWIGYPLTDEEPTIIHHFQFYEELDEDTGGFIYPYFPAGFAMRMELIQILSNQVASGERKLEAEFSIDPAFELAQLVYGGGESPGPLLTPNPMFCAVAADNCATYPRAYDICGSAIAEEEIFFAVKTWSGFHETRAKVVKKTWGKYVTNILFFSDKSDSTLPAIDLGIPNTKTGHCVKTVAILRYLTRFMKEKHEVKWIFLADDDTILGVQRLCEVLSCFRGGADETVIGERYGYGYGQKETVAKGYDFITGGAGTVLSVSAAAVLSTCPCSSLSSPDDMTLGACATYVHNMSFTHVPLFHQNRPQDYSRESLARDRPVSFHRHSLPEPQRVYATWFLRDDILIKKKHDEL